LAGRATVARTGRDGDFLHAAGCNHCDAANAGAGAGKICQERRAKERSIIGREIMDIPTFEVIHKENRERRKKAQSATLLIVIGGLVIGISLCFFGLLPLLGFVGTDTNRISIAACAVSMGVAYIAIGASAWLTGLNAELAGNEKIIEMNAIGMMLEETQTKIGENNKLVQELLTELRMKNK